MTEDSIHAIDGAFDRCADIRAGPVRRVAIRAAWIRLQFNLNRHIKAQRGQALNSALSTNEVSRVQQAAVTMISTLRSGRASLDSPHARAGACPSGTQASHTAFMASKSAMSASHTVA